MSSSTYSPPKRINVSQAARQLGKGEASIRRWIQQFSIPTSVEGGQNMLSADMLDVLAQIKALREQNLRAEDIELNIAEAIQNERQQQNMEPPGAQQASAPDFARQMMADLTEALTEHNEALAQSVSSAVQQATRMADRYAESQRELGRMEAMLQGIQYQLKEAEQKARLLPEKAQALQEREREARQLNEKLSHTEQSREALQQTLSQSQAECLELKREKTDLLTEVAALKAQLAEKESENQALQAELTAERNRGWWDKLTGNKA